MIQSFLSWLGTNFNFPAIVFCILLTVGLWVLWRAQKDPGNNFDLKEMLRDAEGKPSAMRFGVFVALATSTWAMMTMVIANTLDPTIFLGYVGFWTGGAVANKFVEAYQATRGGQVTATEPEAK